MSDEVRTSLNLQKLNKLFSTLLRYLSVFLTIFAKSRNVARN